MKPTALKPQNLVRDTNSKTHLTNHCLGIRSGKNLSEVVKPQGEIQIHIHIFQYFTNKLNRNQLRFKQLIERKRYIVDDY